MATGLTDDGRTVPVRTGMVWGVRRSLLGYIRRLHDGQIRIDDEVGLTPGAQFHFPLDAVDLDARSTGVLRFRGAVRLSGHAGMLDVDLRAPWLHLAGDSATLSVDLGGEGAAGSRTEILVMNDTASEVVAGIRAWSDMKPTLAAAGVDLFRSYPAGTPFDPLSVRIPFEPAH